jgi:Condensation domain
MQARDVEDIYGLTPTQSGILYYALQASAPGMYAQQGTCAIDGPLDVERLRDAWQSAIDAHAVLRTGFRWRGLAHPVQIVRRRASMDFRVVDWHEATDWPSKLEAFLEQDLDAGFDLEQCPLLRVCLLRRGVNAHHLIWTYHHIILDAWSEAIVLRHVLAHFNGARGDASPSFHQYVSWLTQRSDQSASGQARDFWSRHLANYVHRPLPLLTPSASAASYTVTRTIGNEARTCLASLAAQARVTPHAVLLAMWSQWLARHTWVDDVVIGVTTSGRGADLPAPERHVGLLFCTVPIRVHVGQQASLVDLARSIQRDWAAIVDHQHTPPPIVRECVSPASPAVFDTVMVFLNADLQVTERHLGAAIVRDVHYRSRSNYPLTFRVIAGDPMLFEIVADPRYVTHREADAILAHLERTLVAHSNHAAAV